MNNYYDPNSWNAVCDICGWKFKMKSLRKRWDGLMVCDKDYEINHPQKFLRVRETGLAVEPVRQRPPDNLPYVCYLYARPAYADLGEADCMRADITFPSYTFALQLKNAAGGN